MLVGGTPIDRTGGNPIRASSAATTMSQCKARSVPPARQLPCTCAMTGMRTVPDLRPAGGQLEHRGHVALDAARGACRLLGLDVLGKHPVAGREGATRAADHHRLRPRGRRPPRRPPSSSLADAAGGEGVVLLRTVEGQPPNRADGVGEDRVGRVGGHRVVASVARRRCDRVHGSRPCLPRCAGSDVSRTRICGAPCSRRAARGVNARRSSAEHVGSVAQHDPGSHILSEDVVGDTRPRPPRPRPGGRRGPLRPRRARCCYRLG